MQMINSLSSTHYSLANVVSNPYNRIWTNLMYGFVIFRQPETPWASIRDSNSLYIPPFQLSCVLASK